MCDITPPDPTKSHQRSWRINLHTVVANSLTKLTKQLFKKKTRECRYKCCLYGKRSIMSMLHNNNNIWPQWDISILSNHILDNCLIEPLVVTNSCYFAKFIFKKKLLGTKKFLRKCTMCFFKIYEHFNLRK
jgi:hypothetical protein